VNIAGEIAGRQEIRMRDATHPSRIKRRKPLGGRVTEILGSSAVTTNAARQRARIRIPRGEGRIAFVDEIWENRPDSGVSARRQRSSRGSKASKRASKRAGNG